MPQINSGAFDFGFPSSSSEPSSDFGFSLSNNNNEQEEAIESLVAETQGDDLKIGLNANYLLDVLNHLGEGPIRLLLSDTEHSILIESLHSDNYQYIIMPMKI